MEIEQNPRGKTIPNLTYTVTLNHPGSISANMIIVDLTTSPIHDDGLQTPVLLLPPKPAPVVDEQLYLPPVHHVAPPFLTLEPASLTMDLLIQRPTSFEEDHADLIDLEILDEDTFEDV
jgi:hypothetical protein